MDNAYPKLGIGFKSIYTYFWKKAQTIKSSLNFLTYTLYGIVSFPK